MTHAALRPVLLALSVALLPAGAAAASSGLYLDVPTIPGGSTEPGQSGKIDVAAFSWGVSVPIGTRLVSPPAIGRLSVQDMTWVQGLDSSVVPLFSHIAGSIPVASARFDAVKPGAPNNAPYLSLSAEQSVISSMSFGGSGGQDGTSISASLNSSVVELRYDPGALGGTGPALTTRYDLSSRATTGPSGRQPVPGAGTVPATAGLYMRLGGGATAIAGDIRAIGYENWIAIDRFSMGTSLSLGAGGPPSSQPSFSELSWSQSLDATAPAVLFDLLMGQAIGQVTIEQVAVGRNGNPVTVMQQALNDVLFSSFSLSAEGTSNVYLAASMNFTSFSQTLWPMLGDGRRGEPVTIGYDVVNGRSIPGALASNVAGFGNGNLDGLTPPPPIPEPQTWALMLAGLVGLLGLARRRRDAA